MVRSNDVLLVTSDCETEGIGAESYRQPPTDTQEVVNVLRGAACKAVY